MKSLKQLLFTTMMVTLLFVTACSSGSGQTGKQPDNGNDNASTASTNEQSTNKDKNKDKVQLRIMWWGSDTRHEATLKVIELFQQKYPHITFSEEYLGSDGYWDKLNILVAGGNAPDIFQLGNNYPDYVSKNALLDLSPYIGNLIKVDHIDESIIASGKIDDQFYGINLGSNALGVIYNKALIEQSGLNPPSKDWTWEQLEKYLQQLNQALPNVLPMTDVSNNQHFINHFIRQKSHAIYKDGAINFTKEDVIEWFQMWENFRGKGLISDAQTAATYTETGPDKSLLIEGKAVMTVAFSNQLKAYQDLLQDELEMTLLPFGGETTGIWLQPSQFMSVNKNTKHPEEAALFLDFIINDPEATLILGTERGIPGSAQVRDALKENASKVDLKVFNFIDEAIANSREMDRELPNGSEWASVLLNAVQKIAFKTTSIENAAQEVVNAAEQALKK
ncbi:ABC transporter substrate-binding protein [Paenibacillus yanchengensis]|uniref:ABC transporter substrate-binding protein n=1 Tax=Paenibacillus yanchengensis TaxID=2035833 RepID=A0ABW4YPE0_9BACL